MMPALEARKELHDLVFRICHWSYALARQPHIQPWPDKDINELPGLNKLYDPTLRRDLGPCGITVGKEARTMNKVRSRQPSAVVLHLWLQLDTGLVEL